MSADYRVICGFASVDRGDWDAFVSKHPNSNVFQTSQMFEACQQIPAYEPVALFLVDRQLAIAGVLTGVIERQFSGLSGFLTSRAIIRGGPLVRDDNPQGVELLLDAFDQHYGRRCIFVQFRNLFPVLENAAVFSRFGYRYEEHLNILVDLTDTEEILWKKVHSKRRNEIRKARKSGLDFSMASSTEAVAAAYPILQEVYRRVSLPLPGIDFFMKLAGQGILTVFMASYQGELAGAMLALTYNRGIYDYYAGSYQSFYHLCPNDLIPWEVFLWGKNNGFRVFDFGGAGKPDVKYGVRDYKLKFGGELVNYGRFTKYYRPMLYAGIRFLFQAWQKLRKS